MSLLFFDGFDGYDAPTDGAQVGGWYIIYGSPYGAISSTVRVGSGKSMQLYNGGLGEVRVEDQSAKTLYVGFAYMKGNTEAHIIAQVRNSAYAVQCSLQIGTDGFLRIYNGTGTLLATGTHAISASTWYYIEYKLKVANSGGIFDVKLNGVTDITFTGDTQAQATDSVGYIGWMGENNGVAAYYDDVYILNDVGSINNTYLGEQRCELIYPTSDSSVQFSHNTGASNFAAIDELPGVYNDTTDYVYSNTVGNKDEYGLTDLTGLNAVAGVRTLVRAGKDDANPRTLKTGIKSGATDQQIEHLLPIGYGNFIDYFETSDGVSATFTSTTLNSLLFTIQVAS